MKKITGILLALFAFVFSFPTNAVTNSSIDTNAEILLRELNACRDAVLSTIDPNALIHTTSPWEYVLLYVAQRLDSLDVKEIVKIEVTFDIEDGMIFGFYDIQFTDKDGKDYSMTMEEAGGVSCIKAGDKVIWFDQSGPPVVLKWWQKLPNWMQWILRYLCFGWIWMP